MLTFQRDGGALVILRRGQVVGRLWWGEIPDGLDVTRAPLTQSQAVLQHFAPPRRVFEAWLVELDGERRAFSHKAMARAWALQQEERRSA